MDDGCTPTLSGFVVESHPLSHDASRTQDTRDPLEHHTSDVSRLLSDLPALARTCRAFKEPALDMLWKELPDLSPLLQCLPEDAFTGHDDRSDNLRRYARRIRFVTENLNPDHLRILPNPPTAEPLFPNLRHLRCTASISGVMTLLHLPLPSLISLDIKFGNASILHEYFESLPTFSQGFSGLSIRLQNHDDALVEIDQNWFCQWRNLQTLVCSQNVDTLVHLSCLPALTELNFKLDTVFPTLDSRIVFPHLQALTLNCKPLTFAGSLLSQTQLPAVTSFAVFNVDRPSMKRLYSFWLKVQGSGIGHTIQTLRLQQSGSRMHENKGPRLGLDYLRPCMAFSTLRCLDLDVECGVNLNDNGLLALVSAWPHLQTLFINMDWGWLTHHGITPNGLLQLLQTCPSLSHIALVYSNFTACRRQSAANLGSPSPRWLSIDIVDSDIVWDLDKAMLEISTFFASLGPCCHLKSDFYANLCKNYTMLSFQSKLCKYSWEKIFTQVRNQHVCSSDSDAEIKAREEQWARWVQSSHVRMGE